MHALRTVPLGITLLLTLGCGAKRQQAEYEPPPPADNRQPPPAEAPHAVATASAVDDLEVAFKRAIEAAGPAVVSIYSTKTVSFTGPRFPFPFPFGGEGLFDGPGATPRQFQQQGLGSGFIIDESGHILTNAHVIDGADQIRIQLADDREFEASVVGTDPPTDLALLKIDGDQLPSLEYGDSDTLEVGDWVLAIGSPFNLRRTVSAGIVSAKGRANVGIVAFEDFIQTDAAVNPGNSGGPLVDLEGRVVGINTAIASRGGGNNGIAFAVPVNMVKRVVNELMTDGKVVRGHLGVVISELTPELAASFGYPGEDGILVQDVSEGSAAKKAGLRSGDIIAKLDGESVTTLPKLRSDIARRRPGTAMALEVWRDGKFEQLRAELDEAPRTAGEPVTGQQPKLGIELRDITPQIAAQLGLDEGGVVIARIEPGSAADAAGLRPGDLLEEVGNKAIKSAAQAVELLGAEALEKGVRLRVRRNGQRRYIVVKVEP
jgi:serine protease Do